MKEKQINEIVFIYFYKSNTKQRKWSTWGAPLLLLFRRSFVRIIGQGLWNGDYYYVAGYSDQHKAIWSFRVDRIYKQAKILKEDAVPRPASLNEDMAAQFLRCRRRSSLVTAVRFSNGQEALSIVYSGAKYARSVPQIALTWKSLFRVVESGGFLNRLRNGHLEKSAATGLFCA